MKLLGAAQGAVHLNHIALRTDLVAHFGHELTVDGYAPFGDDDLGGTAAGHATSGEILMQSLFVGSLAAILSRLAIPSRVALTIAVIVLRARGTLISVANFEHLVEESLCTAARHLGPVIALAGRVKTWSV